MAQLANSESDINCILINSNLSQTELNFHGTHELMHIYLPSESKGTTFRCYDKIRPYQDSYLEWLANEGAAELLMPYKWFIVDFSELYKLYSTDRTRWIQHYQFFTPFDLLAHKYHVSTMVVKNRIRNLSYEIQQYNQGVDINRIRILSNTQQERLGIQSFDYAEEIEHLIMIYDFGLAWDSVISIE
ncbi:MAG: ImmA/IrrE family metallo-endopeptidase [Ruminococcus sp.]|nr:ImmA/IrrE family metallo-endopeptidase [Ruminococcus sp.]